MSSPYTDDDTIRLVQIHRQHCNFDVYVQTKHQDGQSWHGKIIFLTVHDVGDTPQQFIDFVKHPSMAELLENSVFLHVCMPGQQDGALDLVGLFPTMDEIGENLAHVLDGLDVQSCIGIGEGAGADILCRFALAWPKRVLGLVLIHCMDTAHGIIGGFKEFLASIKLEDGKMNSAAWDYLFTYKYGKADEQKRKCMIKAISERQNLHNLSLYLCAFSRRTDLSEKIKENFDGTAVLLVSGTKTPHNENVCHMYKNMRKAKANMLIMEGINEVLEEAPERFAQALMLFARGFGELANMGVPKIGGKNPKEGAKYRATDEFRPPNKDTEVFRSEIKYQANNTNIQA